MRPRVLEILASALLAAGVLPACDGLIGLTSPSLSDADADDASGMRDAIGDRPRPDAAADARADGGIDGRAPAMDASSDASAEVGAPTLLFPCRGCTVWGITDGGQILASQTSAPEVFTVSTTPMTSGAACTNCSSTSPVYAMGVSGQTAFIWTADGALTLWDPTSGDARQASSASQAGVAATYGALAYFVDGQDLVQAPLADPSSKTILGSATPVPAGLTTPCPRLQVSPAGLYAATCSPADGGAPTNVLVDLWRFDPSGAATAIGSGVSASWSIDGAGDRIFMITAAGTGQVLDASGSLLATVDSNVTDGRILPSGQAVVYVALDTLWQANVASPMPVVLDSPAAGIWLTSPTGAYVLYYQRPLALAGGGYVPMSDLHVVETSNAPKPETVSAADCMPTTFTSDETRLSWFESTDAGAMTAAFVSTPIPPDVQLLTDSPVSSPQAAGGAVLVYNVNVGQVKPDLRVVDTSVLSTDRLIAAGANRQFLVTPDLGSVVYSTDNGLQTGIYEAALR